MLKGNINDGVSERGGGVDHIYGVDRWRNQRGCGGRVGGCQWVAGQESSGSCYFDLVSSSDLDLGKEC